MSIRKRDVHFSDWTKVRHALVCNNVQGITETSSFDDVRAFLINSESGSNPFYYYVCYIKETKEIYTHGQFYDCLKSGDSVIPEKIEELESTLGTKVDLTVFEELQSDVKENELVTARALTELNEKKADSVDLNAIKAEIEENEKVAAKAFMDLNERKLDKSELDNIDLSNYVDWDTYYNNLNTTNSAINLKANKTTVDSLQTTVNLKANQTDLNTLSSEVDLKANKSDLNTLSESLNTLSAEVEENEDVTAAALTELHENKADKSEIPDVSTFATNTDLNTKQDLLVSGTNIKTINGDSILGSGDIEIHDTKVTSAENHYGYNSDNATSTTGAFVTKITKDAANHVTSFESRALTSTDIPGLDASKITSGTIDIARLPKGALEQLHHYETKELAQQAVIDKAVQLGDTVQINHATMYICTNDSATTFATQFTEYVAGAAASVPWSGITGKPDLATQEELDVVDAKFDNYLPLSGGTIYGGIGALKIKRSETGNSYIEYQNNTETLGYIGFRAKGAPAYMDDATYTQYDLLHLYNYRDYVVATNGNSTINGSLTLNNPTPDTLFEGAITLDAKSYGSESYSQIRFKNGSDVSTRYGFINLKGSEYGHGSGVEIGRRNGDSTTIWASIDASGITASSFIGNFTGNVIANSLNVNSQILLKYTADDYKFKNVLSFTWSSDANDGIKLSVPGWHTEDTFLHLTALKGAMFSHTVTASTFIGALQGNADSATKLATARTIWGQSFDGTGNVTGDLTLYASGTNDSPALYFLRGTSADNTVDYKIYNSSGILKFDYIKADAATTKFSYGSNGGFVVNDKITATSYISATHFRQNTIAITSSIDESFRTKFTGSSDASQFISSGRTASSAVGSLLGSWAPLIAFGAGDTHGFLQVGYNSENIKVGGGINDKINWTATLIHSGNYASYALAKTGGSLTGAVTSTSTFSATDFITTSDNRLKDFTKDVIVDFNELKNIPKKYYYWKDKSMGEELQIGTSAQELAKVYPECVSYNEKEDRYSVNYQKLSIIALAAIDKLHERISVLEKKLNDQNS